jgi:hypothetical protein
LSKLNVFIANTPFWWLDVVPQSPSRKQTCRQQPVASRIPEVVEDTTKISYFWPYRTVLSEFLVARNHDITEIFFKKPPN